MKICSKCHIEKDESEYHKAKRSKDGLDWWCKTCKVVEGKKWRGENKNKIKGYNRKAKTRITKWHKENKSRVYGHKAKWTSKNIERYKKYQKKRRLASVTELSDGYIKDLLARSGVSRANMPAPIIEIRRIVLKYKRKKQNK
jgi:hypothetical protein